MKFKNNTSLKLIFTSRKNALEARYQWLTSIFLATQEAEIMRIMV
jgi:hypothetical protein